MAHAHASEALLLCEELEDTRGIAHSLEVFAGLLAAAGFAEAAVRLWGAAEAAWQMWAACLRRRFDGYEIAISRELKSPPANYCSRQLERKGVQCHPCRRLSSRVNGRIKSASRWFDLTGHPPIVSLGADRQTVFGGSDK